MLGKSKLSQKLSKILNTRFALTTIFSNDENSETKMAKIIDDLEHVTMLNDRSMQYPSHYNRRGFMVRFGAIDRNLITNAKIPDMKKRFEKTSNLIVFNQKDTSEIKREDAERFQIVTKHYSKVNRAIFSPEQKTLLKTCEITTVEIVKQLISEETTFKTIESVLYSIKGSTERQKPHADLPTELESTAALAIICLEHNTRFIMLPGSHKGIGEVGTHNFPRIYQLNIGDILIFHPKLIHAGDRYKLSNLRIHYYVIPKASNWKLNLTYLARPTITSYIDSLTKNVSSQEHRVKGFEAKCEEKKSKKRKQEDHCAAMNAVKHRKTKK
jgi:hypothetical protein